MSELPNPSGRRRRADAKRSSDAVLAAAIDLLGRRPEAGLEDVATAAGVSRQTVYTHFASREGLLAAVNDRITTEMAAVLAPVEAAPGAPPDILSRWLDQIWQLIVRYPILLSPAMAALPPCEHVPLPDRLTALIQRGRRSGDFTRTHPLNWLVTATLSLATAANQQMTEGSMSPQAAGTAFRDSVLSLCLPPTGPPNRHRP